VEGRRTLLPAEVAPGAGVSVHALVRAPAVPGRYRLRWDLVCEYVTWFSERGTPTLDQVVEVVAGDGPAAGGADELVASSLEDWVPPARVTRPELWRAALRLWRQHPLLGVGPDNFRRLYPQVIAPPPQGRWFPDERLHANNFYLETLADLGLAGLGALALLIAAVVVQARRHRAAGRLLPVAAAVAVGTFFVHGVLDYFLEFTPSYGLYWLVLALVAGPRPVAAAPASPAMPDSTGSAPPR
jgi:hypothetical protein